MQDERITSGASIRIQAFTQKMYDQYVRLLYARRAAHVDHQRHVHPFRADAAVTSEQTDAAHTERACALHRRDHVGRIARSGDGHQHIARARERLQLPGEYLLETVVVADGGERRRVGGPMRRSRGATRSPRPTWARAPRRDPPPRDVPAIRVADRTPSWMRLRRVHVSPRLHVSPLQRSMMRVVEWPSTNFRTTTSPPCSATQR